MSREWRDRHLTTLYTTCFFLLCMPMIPLFLCVVTVVNQLSIFHVNRYSNCNNTSQNSHEEVEEEDETKLGEVTHEIKVKTDEPKSDLEEAVINQLLPKLIHPAAGQELDSESLEKLSCHDSGIDIRDPAILKQLLPQLQQNAPPQQPPKKYSDADIVLSTEWVPPIPLASHLSANDGRSIISAQAHAQQLNADQGGRKKTSSVSFSVDEAEQPHHNNAINDKTAGDNKKNKVGYCSVLIL